MLMVVCSRGPASKSRGPAPRAASQSGPASIGAYSRRRASASSASVL
jgi:hypothetical protein